MWMIVRHVGLNKHCDWPKGTRNAAVGLSGAAMSLEQILWSQ